MKHVKDFNINEKHKFMSNALKSSKYKISSKYKLMGNTLKTSKYIDYSIEKDDFLRYVWCNKYEKLLTIGKKYKLYAEFKTGAMLSGKCFVIFDNNQQFMGFDSEYFLEDWQWDATKKYNL